MPADKIKDFQQQLVDYMTSRKQALMARIAREKALKEATASELKAAVTEFKQTYH